MSSEVLDSQKFDKAEPIPGYVTQELLGSGGYGEVWKAHAPGGLVKAVKFVYGDINSKRAARELRSLNRIKEVRHPFLLSVERIEIVDGNLVIVTELADSSLKRVFDKIREQGQDGIPRARLLQFLHDAAEALDYIYDNFALQHLDIKPENLLIVGDRLKVADFGLIKNLYERSASLIEGLTPFYAPPEVFDGQPNRNSDQYSLAIVYQEMLTGSLPFDGYNAARLAAQHLHEPPNLNSLPSGDRLIVARALSKQPDKRFSSCCEFVDALMEIVETAPEDDGQIEAQVRLPDNAVTQSQAPPTAVNGGGTIQLFPTSGDGGESADPAAWESPPSRPPPSVNAHMLNACLEEPPELEFDGETAAFCPTIVIGIGGTAARVLSRLKSRFSDRLGCREPVHTLPVLYIDTDVDSLNSSTQGKYGHALCHDEILGIPLRNADEYRRQAPRLLEWLSRRWLYNIPRDRRTKGYRALGRLAWVDHAQRVAERIEELLSNATNEDHVRASEQSTGLQFTSVKPRVVLLASISGGTGSGILLDLAYQVRTLLTGRGFSDENVHAVLMHSTQRNSKEKDKATSNAYAALSELCHYSRAGNCYPGDRESGVPPFHGNNETFASSYLVHLGADLNESDWEAGTDQIAEYLYCDSVTPAARFLDACRQLQRKQQHDSHLGPVMRTFTLCQLGGSNSHIPQALCRSDLS